MREAWENKGRDEVQGLPRRNRSRRPPQAFAARLRAAASGIDPDALADRAAALREGREAEERQVAEDAARERELERQQELERSGTASPNATAGWATNIRRERWSRWVV